MSREHPERQLIRIPGRAPRACRSRARSSAEHATPQSDVRSGAGRSNGAISSSGSASLWRRRVCPQILIVGHDRRPVVRQDPAVATADDQFGVGDVADELEDRPLLRSRPLAGVPTPQPRRAAAARPASPPGRQPGRDRRAARGASAGSPTAARRDRSCRVRSSTVSLPRPRNPGDRGRCERATLSPSDAVAPSRRLRADRSRPHPRAAAARDRRPDDADRPRGLADDADASPGRRRSESLRRRAGSRWRPGGPGPTTSSRGRRASSVSTTTRPSSDRPTRCCARLHARRHGLRFARSGAVMEALVPAILEQKVTGHRSVAGLARAGAAVWRTRAGAGRGRRHARHAGAGADCRAPLLRAFIRWASNGGGPRSIRRVCACAPAIEAAAVQRVCRARAACGRSPASAPGPRRRSASGHSATPTR